jgi:hypothetical protein
VPLVSTCRFSCCGGYDGGFGWRGAVQLCLQNANLGGINISEMEIDNSASDAFDIIRPGDSVSNGTGILTNSIISFVNIPNYDLAQVGSRGLYAASSVLQGSLTVSNCAIADYANDSSLFTFIFTNRPPATNSIGKIHERGQFCHLALFHNPRLPVPHGDDDQSESAIVVGRFRQRYHPVWQRRNFYGPRRT